MKSIGVIFGGMSTEHDVSIVSGASVIKNLDKEKYKIEKIYIDEKGKWYKCEESIEELSKLKVGDKIKKISELQNPIEELKKFDCVFPVLHGLYGEDGTIQGLLELLKIPYVGCKVLASSVCMNKAYTKIVLEKAKISQAKYVYIRAYKNEKYYYISQDFNKKQVNINEIIEIVEKNIKYPVFVKPCNSGSSVGVTKAENKEELQKAILTSAKYDIHILIEEGIKGREVECAVLGNEEPQASCVGEVLSAEDFYTFDSKYHNQESKTQIPANLPKEISEEIRKTAIKAFESVNGEGLARVDFFVEEGTNKVILNEINTMPGFTQISMYPQLWEESGIEYSKLLDKLIEHATK